MKARNHKPTLIGDSENRFRISVIGIAKLLAIGCLLFGDSSATAAPKSGDRFEINSSVPKYYGIFFAFDAKGEAWPSFCYGKPLDGGHWIDNEEQHQGQFQLHFARIAQNSGDQSRRVLGEIDAGNRAQFQWFRGVVDGRELLVAVFGCKDHMHAPRLKAIQSRFGGGHLDGHFVVFDLGKK